MQELLKMKLVKINKPVVIFEFFSCFKALNLDRSIKKFIIIFFALKKKISVAACNSFFIKVTLFLVK